MKLLLFEDRMRPVLLQEVLASQSFGMSSIVPQFVWDSQEKVDRLSGSASVFKDYLG